MRLASNCTKRRHGATVPLTVLLLVPLLGMVAFAVDVGWMTVTKHDLQNVADSAALAGAGALTDGHVKYNLPNLSQSAKDQIKSNAIAKAKAKAKEYAAYNSAGGVSSLSLRDEDIELGFTDNTGEYTPQPGFSGFPNTVKCTLRRDSSANSPLVLFLGGVLGTSEANLTATAAATIYVTDINSFSANPPSNVRMLPMTYDYQHWDNFVATGTDPDGNTRTDSDGNPALKIYASIKYSGNFGLLSLNDGTHNANEIRNWINNGMTKSDINRLLDQQLLPLSGHAAQWDWNGGPGLKQSDIGALDAKVGETYLLPLYKAYRPDPTGKGLGYKAGVGQGQNYDYQIVRFVPVKIISTAHGSVVVQPAAMVFDQDKVVSALTSVPAGTGNSTTQVAFLPPRLTQ